MKHLKENNETYFSHLIFAHKIAIQLCLSGMCLIIHGLFPCWDPPEAFNLESTCKKVQDWNDHAVRRKMR
jgi:hypothetical protein